MAGRYPTSWQPGMWGFGGHLWLPGTAATGNGFGSLTWACALPAQFSDIAPSHGIVKMHRRSRYASVVTTTNQTLGLTTGTVAADRMFYYSGSPGVGGCYMATRFATAFWKDTQRLFVGLCNAGTSMVASNTPAVGAIGLWHDTTDAQTVCLATFDGAGGVTKGSPITPAGTLANDKGWLFELWCYAGQGGTYKAKLTSMDTLLSVFYQTAVSPVSATTFLAPHVEASNGANIVANDVAIDIISVLCTNQF